MINHEQMQLALRTHALTLSVVDTGSVSLSATSTGYARASGSFVTDGFKPGMELTGSGFTNAENNAAKVLTAVTATALTCSGTVTEAAGTRSLTVGLPADRAWENIAFEPTPGSPYVVEQYVPGASRQLSVGPLGTLQADVIYVLQVYTPADLGIGAPSKYADALITLFAPRVALTLTNGDKVRVRTDTGPFRGQLLQREPGWATVPVSFPMRAFTANSN